MKIELLKEQKDAATEKWREYKYAAKRSRDPIYNDMKKIYFHIKSGKAVIDVNKAISAGGVRDNFHPNLAISKANVPIVFLEYNRNGRAKFRNQRWRDRAHDIVIDNCFKTWENGPWALDLQAPVPIIPPRLRPQNLTDDYYILWEVDSWTPSPSRDPYLLKRVTKNLFVVCAAWDLTDIEMAVMAGRIP